VVGASCDPSGRFGGALRFDGNDRVVVPNAADLDLRGAFTVSAWVRPTSSTPWQSVVSKSSSTYPSWLLYARGATSASGPEGFAADRPGNDATARAGQSLPVDQWSHLTMTSDGTTLRLFVNDSEVAQAPAVTAMTVDGDIVIGANTVWPEEGFVGLIDEVRLFDRALTEPQISEMHGTP